MEIITLGSTQSVTIEGTPLGAIEVFLPDPNGGPARPVDATHPLPTQPQFGPSGLVPLAHNFAAADAQPATGPAFSPIAGRPFNIDIRFDVAAVGSIRLARSFDQGGTYSPVTRDGAPVEWAADASESFTEGETGVLYALQTTALAGGLIHTRISQ